MLADALGVESSWATDTMRWSSSRPKMVCATARTSRTVCFAGFALIGEHVHLGRPAVAVADDPHREHAAEPTELVLELAELADLHVRSPRGTPPFAHSLAMLVPPVGSPWNPAPGPCSPCVGTIYGRPTTQSEDVVCVLLMGLALSCGSGETIGPHIIEGHLVRAEPGRALQWRTRVCREEESTVSGRRRQGLGLSEPITST